MQCMTWQVLLEMDLYLMPRLSQAMINMHETALVVFCLCSVKLSSVQDCFNPLQVLWVLRGYLMFHSQPSRIRLASFCCYSLHFPHRNRSSAKGKRLEWSEAVEDERTMQTVLGFKLVQFCSSLMLAILSHVCLDWLSSCICFLAYLKASCLN